jgi:hypothetical protein
MGKQRVPWAGGPVVPWGHHYWDSYSRYATGNYKPHIITPLTDQNWPYLAYQGVLFFRFSIWGPVF